MNLFITCVVTTWTCSSPVNGERFGFRPVLGVNKVVSHLQFHTLLMEVCFFLSLPVCVAGSDRRSGGLCFLWRVHTCRHRKPGLLSMTSCTFLLQPPRYQILYHLQFQYHLKKRRNICYVELTRQMISGTPFQTVVFVLWSQHNTVLFHSPPHVLYRPHSTFMLPSLYPALAHWFIQFHPITC